MLHTLTFATLLVVIAAAPAVYDQRQQGDFNVLADIKDVVLIVAYPDKLKLPTDIFGGFKSSKPDVFQERADVRVMEAFVEPSTPYRVDIGSDSERYADTDGRNVVVEINGQRRIDAEPQEEYKLLGAQEQCGPNRERDPATLICRAVAAPADLQSEAKPEAAAQAEPIKVSEPAKQPEPASEYVPAVAKLKSPVQPESVAKPESAPQPESSANPESSAKPETAAQPESSPQPDPASQPAVVLISS